jgi:phosphoglycolate phosphatase-like HAD superfamily hydrolase
VDLVTAAGASEDQLLAAAAAVEGGSDHPLAQAILRRAATVKAPKATGFKNLEGKGAQAEIDGMTAFLGNRLLMTENKFDLGELNAKSEELQGAGRTVVHLAVADKLVGLIAIADAVRPTAVEAINALRARGVEVAMLTGDNKGTAERIAKSLGIDRVFADVSAGRRRAVSCFAWTEHRRTGYVRQLGARRDQCSDVEADQADRYPSSARDCVAPRAHPQDGDIMISRAASTDGGRSRVCNVSGGNTSMADVVDRASQLGPRADDVYRFTYLEAAKATVEGLVRW